MNKPTMASIIGVIILLLVSLALLVGSVAHLLAWRGEAQRTYHFWVLCGTGLIGAVNCINLGVWLRKALRERKKH